MADRLRKVDYFYVTVPNTAGQGAKVLSGLAAGERIVSDPEGRELSGKKVED